ncbi:Putative cyclase [Xaviernesmea oryzae]|uniref:Putative cyclase n=2 Tax=Xaviernesmea oryzae TaxID=464029 RepID=A0A1X7FPT7_9HYPH|nr:cyclase family protein [Xaviernesmea oryzae]SMF56402.1 Putative cyclase [Xaviernesmea oryzae]
MGLRWKYRPDGSNWGDFGDDDQHGRMNLITEHVRRRALEEVTDGRSFCLSLPLDLPGGKVLNPRRGPPEFHPIERDGHVAFNLQMSRIEPNFTDVHSDEAVLLYNQYSTHWDGFAHKGAVFDINGDGNPQPVFYNGFQIADEQGNGTQGTLGAIAVSVAEMAETCVQGRGVMIDLRYHLGDERVDVDFDILSRILEADKIVVEEGDIVCFHTGLGDLIMKSRGNPDPALRTRCAVLDGSDQRLLDWITDTGVAAIAADNLAVERSSTLGSPAHCCDVSTALPLHRHCLFKLGVHLGELWYLTDLAVWLRNHRRSRFLLTAPPLRLPGAAGAPVTPVATV